MSRPHEDRERHTSTDHTSGGSIVILTPGSWWAIDVLRVAAERSDAAIAAYETLIERVSREPGDATDLGAGRGVRRGVLPSARRAHVLNDP